MNRFERCANARSSTTLPSKPLNGLAMTEMTSKTDRLSAEKDSCDSLRSRIQVGRWSTSDTRKQHLSPGPFQYPQLNISGRVRWTITGGR